MALVSDLYRVTWFWEALGQGGSETMMLRRQDSNTGTIHDGIVPFLQKRAKLLGNQGTLRACRVSKYTDATGARVDHISELRYFSYPGTQTSTKGNVSGDNLGENIAQSLELMCYEPQQQRKKIIYLGYPWENCLPGNQLYEPAPAFATLLGSWITDLVQGGWGWIGKTQGTPLTITGYTEHSTTGKVTLTVGAPVVWPSLSKPFEVNINFVGRNPLDGRKLVVATSDTTVTTIESIGVRPFTQVVTGFMRLMEPFFYSLNPGFPATQNVGRIGVVQPVRRARGKPMPSTRGRSPTEVRW